jgi:hypothetical protein
MLLIKWNVSYMKQNLWNDSYFITLKYDIGAMIWNNFQKKKPLTIQRIIDILLDTINQEKSNL